MSLLHCLANWPTGGLTVCAVHVHHGLRGDEADRDVTFVQEQCAALGVPLTVEYVDVPAEITQTGESVEQAARRLRYGVFDRVAAAWHVDAVATAHTAGDQAETVLLRLLRGCGVDGLAGIPVKRDNLVRPLLSCTRAEVEEFCARRHIPYVQDSTNGDTAYTRNRVRQELLPLLRQFNPLADDCIRRLAAHAAQDSAYLNELAADALEYAYADGGYRAAAFAAQPSPVRRRMLRQLLFRFGCYDYAQAHLVSIDEAVLKGQGAVSLPGYKRVTVSQGRISLQETVESLAPAWLPIDVTALPKTLSFGVCRFRVSLMRATDVNSSQNVHKMFFKSAIDCDRIQGGLFIRARQEGDMMHPAGRRVGKSIKKLMNELKIPAMYRDSYPLLCDAQGVIWLPGYCCDERVKPQADTRLFLVWEPLTEQE